MASVTGDHGGKKRLAGDESCMRGRGHAADRELDVSEQDEAVLATMKRTMVRKNRASAYESLADTFVFFYKRDFLD